VTAKLIEFDFGYPSNPSDADISSPVSTDTWAVAGSLNKAAGMTAVSSVLLTNLVLRKVSTPFTDHIAHVLLGKPSTKFVPVTVSVRSGVPAIALVGEIEVIEGASGGGGGVVVDVVAEPCVGRTGLVPQPQSNASDKTRKARSLTGHLPADWRTLPRP
jgi:hypothetical protein